MDGTLQRHWRVPLIVVLAALLLAAMAAVSDRAAADEDNRWILVQTLVNPGDYETTFINGVTPNWYGEPRFEGKFIRNTVTPGSISTHNRHVDHGFEYWNYVANFSFDRPPDVLTPGETVKLRVSGSISGSYEESNPGERFGVWVEGAALRGANTFRIGLQPDIPSSWSVEPEFDVPTPWRSDSEILIQASGRCSGCDVLWVYWTKVAAADLPTCDEGTPDQGPCLPEGLDLRPKCDGLLATIGPDERDAWGQIIGTDGDDVIVGTYQADFIKGGGGHDVICGRAGDDTIRGGRGMDTIFGERGDDKIRGEGNRDYIEGGWGEDTIWGGSGNDRLKGNEQNDKIHGEAGRDAIKGGTGDDQLWGHHDGFARQPDDLASDKIYGGDGHDRIWGGGGGDILNGGPDEDYIQGGLGRDRIQGGDGFDWLWGHQRSGTTPWIPDDKARDTIYGGKHNDHLYGGQGRDRLFGGRGQDSLWGGGGHDYLHGGIDGDRDTLSGGSGEDECRGEAIRDILDFSCETLLD